jgi:hypothetical protein
VSQKKRSPTRNKISKSNKINKSIIIKKLKLNPPLKKERPPNPDSTKTKPSFSKEENLNK